MFINAIVVIYKSRIVQSDTIKAIFQADLSHINLTITIWNNGPEFLEQDDINNYMEKCRQYGISSSVYQDIETYPSARSIIISFRKKNMTSLLFSIKTPV